MGSHDPASRPVLGTSGRAVVTAAVLVALLAAPFVSGDYRLFQFTMALVSAIAVLGLNLLVGFNGQISLGHGAFYAIGAYTAAILMDRYGWPYWATLPVAGLACLAFGGAFGLPALRLEGHYLALATFALAIVVPQILRYGPIEDWTGGVQGVTLVKPDAPFGLPLTPDQWLYLFTLAVAALMFGAARNLTRGRIGRAMVAIRDQPIAAAAMGIDTAYYKTATFAISGLFTGIAGALAAIVVQYVSPDSFGLFLSVSLLVGAIVGGIGTIAGAAVGALFIQFVPNLAGALSKSAPWAVYGACLIVCVYVMPGGAVAFARRVLVRLGRRTRRPAAAE